MDSGSYQNHIFICAKPFNVSLFQIGVHFGGTFYEFVPWNGVVEWEITQWGHWHVTADNETHKVIMLQIIACQHSKQIKKKRIGKSNL